MNLLEVKKLSKQYKGFQAVKKIDFHLKQGEILGFLGPNGAGKSTTISMISTLFSQSDGDILLNGKNIKGNEKELRRMLGVVPQEVALYPDLTGYENLAFFGRVYGLSRKEVKERVVELLKLLGLSDRANEKVENYSGGMKRRINIGAALLHKPKILVMDEPTVGIDPQSRNHILTMVKKLNEEGMTVLYTSHYMEEVELLCDRIYIMDHGKIIAEGTKQQLKDLIAEKNSLTIDVELVKDAFTELLTTHPLVKAVLPEEKSYTIVLNEYDSIIVKDVVSLAEKTNTSILSVKIKTPSLEDVFLQLTGRGLRD